MAIQGTSTPPALQPARGTVLFIQGVADDGLIKISAQIPDRPGNQQIMSDLNRFSSASLISRHILGSLSHFEYVSVPGLANETLLLVGEQNQTLKFNIPQVIVNCIVDPDVVSRALVKGQKLIEQVKQQSNHIPVINPPAGILRTTRDQIYQQFKDLPGLTIPRVIRLAPVSVADTVRQIKEADMALPLLIRPAGTHGGKGMQRIDDWSPESLLKLEQYAYDGRFYYVTEWVDFKSRDGFYRKSRLVAVGGAVIARHRIVSDSWNVHSQSRKLVMQPNPELCKEEEAFIGWPVDQSVSAEAMASLGKIYQSLGLDYFGVDCNIRDDGTLTVFEINAAVNAMTQKHLDIYPYLANPVQRIIKAFNDLVAQKATLARAA